MSAGQGETAESGYRILLRNVAASIEDTDPDAAAALLRAGDDFEQTIQRARAAERALRAYEQVLALLANLLRSRKTGASQALLKRLNIVPGTDESGRSAVGELEAARAVLRGDGPAPSHDDPV